MATPVRCDRILLAILLLARRSPCFLSPTIVFELLDDSRPGFLGHRHGPATHKDVILPLQVVEALFVLPEKALVIALVVSLFSENSSPSQPLTHRASGR